MTPAVAVPLAVRPRVSYARDDMDSFPDAPLDVRRIHDAIRALSGKELTALAKRAGVGRTTLYNLRANTNRDRIRLGTLVRIQEALNAPAEAD